MTGDPCSSPESVSTDLAEKTLVGWRWWGCRPSSLCLPHSCTLPPSPYKPPSGSEWLFPQAGFLNQEVFLDLLNLVFNCMQIQIKLIVFHNGCIHDLPRKRKWPCYSGQHGERWGRYLALNQRLRISYISVSRVSQARSPLPSIWSPLEIFGTTFPSFKNITYG